MAEEISADVVALANGQQRLLYADWSFGVGALMYVRLRHTGEVRHPQPQTRRWGFKQHNPAVKSLLERRRFLLRYLWRGRWPV